MESTYYGFDLDYYTKSGIGFGAVIYDIMLAYHHTKLNNLILAFVKEGYDARWFDGSKEGEIKVRYHDIFINPFPLVSRNLIKDIWNHGCSKTVSRSTPDNIDSYVWYSDLMKYVFKLTPQVQEEVERRIELCGFKNDDILLHIRRTDKIKVREYSCVEAGEMSVDDYIREVMGAFGSLTNDNAMGAYGSLNNGKEGDKEGDKEGGKDSREPKAPISPIRVFLCTDDMEIVDYCYNKFKENGVEMIYDKTQDKREIQSLRMAKKLDIETTMDENLRVATIIVMMSRCKYLIGGRLSMLFRVGELLRYPMKTLNLKDSDAAGRAQYARKDEPMMRPMSIKTGYNEFISGCNEVIKKNSYILIKNFINPDYKLSILNKIKEFHRDWWGNNTPATTDVSRGQHYNTCNCFACTINSVMLNEEVKSYLQNLIGGNVITVDSRFTKYERGDYKIPNKSQHYSLILPLTEWNYTNGGLIHTVESGNKIKTIVLSYGDLILINPGTEYFISSIIRNELILYSSVVIKY